MLTLEELRLASLNAKVVEEAHRQAEKRLLDILDTKKNFEQKAFVLFNAYLTLSLAVLGVSGTLYRGGDTIGHWLPFLISGCLLVLGAVSFFFAMTDRKYGAVGSDPNMWLVQGVVDADGENVVTAMLAYITSYYQERIYVSNESNESKAASIRRGMYIGLASPISLLLSLIVT